MSRLSKISSITFKLIYVCLALSLVFACIPADANNKEAISTLFEKQAAGIVQYRELMATIDNSDYGGAYLDEDGKLVVLVVNQNNVENAVNNAKASLNIKKRAAKPTTQLLDVNNISFDRTTLHKAENQQIVLKPAKYSMEYLNEVKAKLENVMEELNIFTLSIDEEINKILVETDVISDEFKSQIYEIADDTECIEFGVTSQPMPMSDPVFNGQRVYYIEGNKEHSFSIGMGIQLNDGRVGWLTAGHCWTSDIYNYVQSSSCGTLIGQFDPILHAYGEQGDYAFIERPKWLHYINTTNMFAYRQSTDRWNTSGNINDLGSGISWGYPKNTSVTAYGSVTGAQDGVIKNTNLTVKYYEGERVKHLISMTGKIEKGDSGGPVAVKTVGAGTGSAVIGIISGGVGMWPTRIYFTDMGHIYNQLGGFEGHADYIRW